MLAELGPNYVFLASSDANAMTSASPPMFLFEPFSLSPLECNKCVRAYKFGQMDWKLTHRRPNRASNDHSLTQLFHCSALLSHQSY